LYRGRKFIYPKSSINLQRSEEEKVVKYREFVGLERGDKGEEGRRECPLLFNSGSIQY
jgi:hypothetical protein